MVPPNSHRVNPWVRIWGNRQARALPPVDTYSIFAMTTTCRLAWAAVLLLLPLIVIWNLTESRHTKINRWRSQGQTWKAIAIRLGCSPTTAKRWALG